MVDRFYGYQYDTSPRKLSQQEHTPYKNRYSQDKNYSNDSRLDDYIGANKKSSKNNTVKRGTSKSNSDFADLRNNVHNKIKYQAEQRKQEEKQSQNYTNKKQKLKMKQKLKIVICLIAGFSALFAISYQNSLISESFNKKEQYKKEMEALSKTNQQLEVSIENSLNMNNIEQAAKDKLGMQKLNNNQKIYVSLPKQDYVAPAAEQIIIEEDSNFFEKLVNGFTKAIK